MLKLSSSHVHGSVFSKIKINIKQFKNHSSNKFITKIEELTNNSIMEMKDGSLNKGILEYIY